MKLLKHKYLLVLVIAAATLVSFAVPATTQALCNPDSGAACSTQNTTGTTGITNANKAAGSSSTSSAGSTADPTVSQDCKQDTVEQLNEKNCGIIGYIVTITNVLSALVGVVIVAMIIWGGILYSMAGADPSKVQAAKQKIFNALLALVLFIFGFALVQWLIPGGLF